MKFLLAIFVLPAFISAHCFGGGELTYKPFARGDRLDKVCDQLAKTYSYKNNDLKNYASMYMPIDDNTKCYLYYIFLLSHQSGNTEETLSHDACTDLFKSEINGCDRGGQSEVDDTWRVLFDPNEGACPVADEDLEKAIP